MKNNQFDELAKSMAQSITRRAALKKLGLGLGVATLTLMTLTPVRAAPARRTIRYSGKLLPVGDEQRASGFVRLSLISNQTSGSYRVEAICKNLTPGASYDLRGYNSRSQFALGIHVADQRGTVQYERYAGYGTYIGAPNDFEVYRIETAGNVLVLSGSVF